MDRSSNCVRLLTAATHAETKWMSKASAESQIQWRLLFIFLPFYFSLPVLCPRCLGGALFFTGRVVGLLFKTFKCVSINCFYLITAGYPLELICPYCGNANWCDGLFWKYFEYFSRQRAAWKWNPSVFQPHVTSQTTTVEKKAQTSPKSWR